MLSADIRMGQPSMLEAWNPKGGKPGELKHLSTRRKRKQFSDFPSSGERTGKSLNFLHVIDYSRCVERVVGLLSESVSSDQS